MQGEWVDSSFGHGRAYRYTGPAGHTEELFWEVDRAVAPAGEESPFPERPQRAPSHGIGVRILDHVTVTAPDVRAATVWHRDVLDFRVMGGVEGEPGSPWFLGLASCNEKSHDFGFILDFEGKPGRLHHVAFWVETNHDLTQGATFLIEHGHDVDFGPGQHGIGEQNYLYFRDPAGLRYAAQLRRLPHLRARLGAGGLALRGRAQQHVSHRDRHARGPHEGDPAGHRRPQRGE